MIAAIPIDREYDLGDLDIGIVSIELTLEKSMIATTRLEKESDTSITVHDKKVKYRFLSKKLPLYSLGIDGIMQGREHLACDEYSLLIGAIDGDLEGDDVRRVRQGEGDRR
jgi:hypothetical protein